jgi:hypothetical protein
MMSTMAEPAARQIRVFLLDDHEVVRRGVADLLDAEPDLVVVGEAETAAEALRRARPQQRSSAQAVPGTRAQLAAGRRDGPHSQPSSRDVVGVGQHGEPRVVGRPRCRSAHPLTSERTIRSGSP